MNIILILADALRPDHLGVNGYSKDTSPNIDRISKQGTSFINAYCPLPRSDPSITSILTGMYPHSHGIRLVHNKKLNPSISMLPEILCSHDYKTAFMGGSGLHNEGLERSFGDFSLLLWKIKNKFKRGIYKIPNPKNFLSVSQQYTDIAMKWIKKNSGKKFFLFLHYEDLHWPYIIPKPYETMFDPGYKGKHDFNTLANGKFSRGDILFGNVKLPKEEVEHAIAHYDGGIRFIDTQVGRILDFIKEQNLVENTLVIVTSDHGENFGEHDFYFQHGASLYETSLKVPLIFLNPKTIPKAKVISARVQNLDIMPTVLDILKIPLVDKIDGQSLLPLIHEKTTRGREYIFAESIEEHFKGNKRVFMKGVKGKWRAMIVGYWKIIYIPHPEKDIFELYNLREDSSETKNLIDQEKETASQMKKMILDFLKLQSNEGDVNLEDLTEKSKKLLRKLGYIE